MSLLQEIKTSYTFRKYLEVRNRFTYVKAFKPMSQSMERYKICTEKKDSKQIQAEINNMKRFWNCRPFQYYRYDLYRKDKELTYDELNAYIPEFFFYRLYLPYYANKEYDILLTDKIILNQYFQSINIPQPNSILKIINGNFYNGVFDKVSSSVVIKELISKNTNDIFLKPISGRGGYGIKVFTRKNAGYEDKEGNILNENYLNSLDSDSSFIMQEGLKQHAEVSAIYSLSINTFRIATENKDGRIKILFCMLRIGKGGSKVDNFSQGNLIASVNLNTGKLEGPAFSPNYDLFEKHPDSGFIFSSFENMQWNKIKEFVLTAASKMPQFTYLGWDIALTENGPVAIEVNKGFDLDMVQISQGGAKELFNIDDPMFYWKSKRRKG